MTLKTIDSFISTVDPHKATVVSFPEFIAIFGGPIRFKKSRANPKSNRDAFYRWILEHRSDLKELLLIPENYNDWNDSAIYSDLLLFEKDLGYLTSAVLIFLESPGSIAELGAFSQIDSLSKRLMVVVKDGHHPQKSFISLGPIRSIEKTQKHAHSVCVIPDVKPEQLMPYIPSIVEMLDLKRARTKNNESRKRNDQQHQILLILDFINLFLVIQKNELKQLAMHFGFKLSLRRLNQLLFLLEKTALITCKHSFGNQYYSPRKFNKYIDYTSKTNSASFKRETTKARVMEEIQNDQPRKNAYELVMKEGGSK